MKKIYLAFIAILMPGLAAANWEQRGPFRDDGSRFVVSVRGGLSMPQTTMRNDLGDMIVGIWDHGGGSLAYVPVDPNDLSVGFVTDVNFGNLGMTTDFTEMSLVYGISVGVVMAGNTNVRFELDWLRIEESQLSANPLFSGDVDTSLGTIHNAVAAARASMQTDIISAFVYYDFFEGRIRPTKGLIPYIGLGLGFVRSESILMLSDPYGDFAGDPMFTDFGNQIGDQVRFFTSETNNRNYALSAAIGAAYGLGQNIYFDIGARASYVPSVRFALNNSRDATALQPGGVGYREMDMFSARDMIFLNVFAGLRFEF